MAPAKIRIPKGTVCETTCVNVEVDPPKTFACQVYCSPVDAGGNCSCNGGYEPEAGFCPGLECCMLQSLAHGGEGVFC